MVKHKHQGEIFDTRKASTIWFKRLSQQVIHPLPTPLLPKVPAPIVVGLVQDLHMEHPILSGPSPHQAVLASYTKHEKLPQTEGFSWVACPKPSSY